MASGDIGGPANALLAMAGFDLDALRESADNRDFADDLQRRVDEAGLSERIRALEQRRDVLELDPGPREVRYIAYVTLKLHLVKPLANNQFGIA